MNKIIFILICCLMIIIWTPLLTKIVEYYKYNKNK